MTREPTINERLGTPEQRLAVLHQLSLGLAHDFRTPLTLIVNALQLLRTSGGDPAVVQEGTALIEAEVGALKEMLDDLCDITAPRPADLERCEVRGMCEDALKRADPRGRVNVVFSGLDEERFIWCERRSFTRVLGHLCENAVRAMKGRGTLRVCWRSLSDRDLIEVGDTGPGIEQVVVDHLFEPLVTTRRSGLGLGLAYCRAVVERLDGTIDLGVTSESGTSIRISLPQA